MKKLPLLVLGVSLLLQPGFAQEQIPDGESLSFSGLTVREARRVNARLQNIYQKAVKEAQEITPGKMSDRLWSVDDPWVDRKGDSLVLVVAAIQTKDLPKWTGKAAKQAPASRDEAIWVSLSPELGMVMHNQPLLDSLSAAMRIKQILGLPPQADYGYIVQFWVPVSQLVRPTPDPDVHNHFSTVKFPQQVDPGHKQWIEHLRSTTYTSDPPYPWTQLGYTYDWGNPYSSVGVSEFVIKPGAAIRIEQLATIWLWYTQQVDVTAEDIPTN